MVNFLTWITIIIVVGAIFGRAIIQHYVTRDLINTLVRRDFDNFFKRVDGFWATWVVPAFTREYMKMNAFRLQKDLKSLDKQYQLLLDMRASKDQHADVAKRAFYDYVDRDDQKHAKVMLASIQQLADSTVYQQCMIMYSVYCLKEAKYIDEVSKQLKSAHGFDQVTCHVLLALQYRYLGQQDEAGLHSLAAKQLLEQNS